MVNEEKTLTINIVVNDPYDARLLENFTR